MPWIDVTNRLYWQSSAVYDSENNTWSPPFLGSNVGLLYGGRVPLLDFAGVRVGITNTSIAGAASVVVSGTDINSTEIGSQTSPTIQENGDAVVEVLFSATNDWEEFDLFVSRDGSSGNFIVTSIELLVREFEVAIPPETVCALNSAASWETGGPSPLNPHPFQDDFLGGFWVYDASTSLGPEAYYFLYSGEDALESPVVFTITSERDAIGGELGDDTLWYTFDGGQTWISPADGSESTDPDLYEVLPQTAGDSETYSVDIPEGSGQFGIAFAANNQVGSLFNAPPSVPYRLVFACPAVEPDCVINCDCTTTENSQPLSVLRNRMLVRLGFSARASSPPPGMLDLIDEFLRSAQQKLYRRPEMTHFMSRWFEWPVAAGQRLFGIMDADTGCERTLDARKIEWLGIIDQNNVWHRLTYGIPPELYTNLNPSLPVRYEVRQCIEIFPPPDNDDYCLVAKGDFGLLPLSSPEDRCTLPEELVFLTALADAKFHFGMQDAQVVKIEAQQMMGDLIADSHMQKRYVPGGKSSMPWPRPQMVEFDS